MLAYTRNDDDDDEGASKDDAAKSSPVEQALFDKRYVLITGGINDRMARRTCERLLALAAASDDPINVFISSPGGHVESGDMIHDVIRFIKPKVRAIGSGWVASAGALIFVAVPLEQRYCLPNTRFLLHQPSGGVGGKAVEIEIQAEQLRKMKERLYQIFADATGQDVAKVEADMERDFWLTTDEALRYGLLGRIIQSQDELD